MITTATLDTHRLHLRPWREEDAPALYLLARDPEVGPPAGWLPHKSEAESLTIIRTVLAASLAITDRGSGALLGCTGFYPTSLPEGQGELELGYWIGRPYWGRGYATEAARGMLGWAFGALGQPRVWCSHYDGNERSRRVMAKCGFLPVTARVEPVPALESQRLTRYYALTKERYFPEKSAPKNP